MIPDEDLGPAWLRDYGHTDFGDIEADILAMEEFAARLKANVEQNYGPLARGVSETMQTALPAAHAGFRELQFFQEAHDRARRAAQQNVFNFGPGTYGFATAAGEVGQMYRGTDEFARAKVTDVQSELRTVGILPPAEEA
jgi:hypothetical protein